MLTWFHWWEPRIRLKLAVNIICALECLTPSIYYYYIWRNLGFYDQNSPPPHPHLCPQFISISFGKGKWPLFWIKRGRRAAESMRARVKIPTHVLWSLLRTQEIRVSLGGNMHTWCHSTELEPDREVWPNSAGDSSDSWQCRVPKAPAGARGPKQV